MTDALADYLDHPDDWQERRDEQWRVRDLGSADWCMRKVAQLDHEKDAIDHAAAEQIETIKAWWQTELDRLAHQRAHWEWLLAQWHLEKLGEDPKAKTIRLPHGVLSARKQPDNIDIADPDAVIALFAADSEYVRVKRELNRSAIKDAVLKNGEILPGVSIVPGEITYNASPN